MGGRGQKEVKNEKEKPSPSTPSVSGFAHRLESPRKSLSSSRLLFHHFLHLILMLGPNPLISHRGKQMT